MPNVTNVVLNLQHGGDHDANARRRATVTFTTTFNSTEELAGTVFEANVSLRSSDGTTIGGKTFVMPSEIIKAVSGTVTRTVSSDLTRRYLDEDIDVKLVGPPGHKVPVEDEDQDEWLATVTIFPVVFGSDTRNSDVVVGSWGKLGSAVDN